EPILSRLRNLGVRLTTDDFGAGYSSLNYLHRFPVSGLKIDQSFISSMTGQDETAEIVRTIVTLGNSLGLDVVAEGVETTKQLDILHRVGCPHGQGFLFSKPLPSRDAGALIVAGSLPRSG